MILGREKNESSHMRERERERERDLSMKDEGIQNKNLEFQSILGQRYYCDKFQSIEGQSRVGLKIEIPYEFFDQLRVDQSDPKNKNFQKQILVDQKVIKSVQIRKMYNRLFTKKKGNRNMLEVEFNMLSIHV